MIDLGKQITAMSEVATTVNETFLKLTERTDQTCATLLAFQSPHVLASQLQSYSPFLTRPPVRATRVLATHEQKLAASLIMQSAIKQLTGARAEHKHFTSGSLRSRTAMLALNRR